ncbi:hypothetical protein C8A01DRAFT_15903 [Parachaetomium inaequale]|uniref:CENP-V/GFA domain-containing protein n=1 Tax=Parachaetomium inaequale TaxID=2588326 RepID=A0AAN6PFX1_9PEZI|nr:hypothetical protein C8A01DRAFT_15903 [Parachaetomium inaequale]
MSSTTNTDTITLKAQCLCRAHSFTTSVPVSALPLKGSSCHCTSCRHVTGALRASDAVWPGPSGDILSAAAAAENGTGTVPLKRYPHSPRVNVLFCGRCGSGLFFEEGWEQGAAAGLGSRPGEAKYLVFTGALSVDVGGEAWRGGLPPLVRGDHIFVGDTVDGGAVGWLRGVNGDGEPARVWLGRRDKSEEVPPGVAWPAVGSLPAYGVDLKAAEGNKGDVPIRCHCRGIDLVLRAGEAQREFEEMQRKGEELPWFVDPVTHKGMGSLDACDSCRIAAGSEVYNWTFALLRHISFAGADPQGFPEDTAHLRAATSAKEGEARDPRFGTIAFYASSPDVQRYFCGRCSATLFYAVDERPDIVDVAVGLLDSPDGARAESAISWSFGGEMSWRRDMIGTWRERMLYAVEKEAEEWRVERGYPKGWRRVAKEQAQKAGGN